MICSARARALITYDADGQERGERKPCTVDRDGDSGRLPSPHYSVRANVPTIASNWLAAIAIPLWHPFVAWLMGLVGIVVLKFTFRASR